MTGILSTDSINLPKKNGSALNVEEEDFVY